MESLQPLQPHDEVFDEAELAAQWFDVLVSRFRGVPSFVLHRHMVVRDFSAYVDGLENDTETTGEHWSTSEGTVAQVGNPMGADVLLTGEIGSDQVEWYATFQNFFVFPEESKITFVGPIRLLSVRNLDTGEVHQPLRDAYRTDPEEENTAPAMA